MAREPSKKARAIEKELLELRDAVATNKRIKVGSPRWDAAVAEVARLRALLNEELGR